MRRVVRLFGLLLIVAGVGTLAWVVTVWRWQDPLTALYTHWKQRALASQYERRVRAFSGRRVAPVRSLAAERTAIAALARRYRRESARGDAVGRLTVPALGLNRIVVVNGTDHDSLKRGPGRDLRTYMPGQGHLVYVAGHRTTYGAPFARINSIRRGDRITFELPYATFEYRVTGHRIVDADDLSVLRSHRREQLILQACHPRFFASHRYLAYAKAVRVAPRHGPAYDPSRVRSAAAP